MSINYVGLLMYDFPMKTGEERKEYTTCLKLPLSISSIVTSDIDNPKNEGV